MQSAALHNAIRLALYGATLTLLAPVAAHARQDTQPKAQAESLEVITVLGSRIKRSTLETSQPVVSIDRQELEKTGLTQIGDVLKELTVNGPSLGLQTNNGNTSGNTSVNLRGCSSLRTLVLVNGRRWISSTGLGGAVDLGSIPFAAVERVEILKDGASALYGTDAICGVINIVTKSTYNGVKATAYYGQYDQDDGVRTAYDVTFGKTEDRWSVLANLSYSKQEAVMAGNRAISSVPVYGIPGNVSTPGRASPVTPYGFFGVGGVNYTLDPNLPGCRPNQRCTARGDFRPYDFSRDGYNFSPVNYLLQPQETQGAYLQGSFKINDRIRLHADGFFSKRTGEAQLAAQPLAPLTIDANNIYNPFGVRITGAQFRPTLFPRTFGQSQITRRYSFGADGNFDIGDRNFNWDVTYSRGQNKFNQYKSGFELTSRLQQALGPSFIDASGKPTCGTVANPATNGCVPLNLFGGPTGVTPEMFNFMAVSPHNIVGYSTSNFTANVSGPIVALPGGDLSLAAGYEYRKEYGYSYPDPRTAAGVVFNDVPFLPTEGGYHLNEVYFEASVPLLKDLPFVHSLELSPAVRHSRYSNFGSTTNPKLGIQWRPIEDLLVRGSWGKGFRAPSIGELFAGRATGRPSINDPCSVSSVANQNPDVRAACQAAGIPANFRNINAQAFLTTGGNPNLGPETSTNRTFGLVYSPGFIEGFDVSADWYSIRLTNNVGARGAQSILDDCYIFGIQSRCSQITRDMTGAQYNNVGEIVDMISLNQNFRGGLEIEGFDFAVNYRHKTDSWGEFRANWANAYTTYNGDLGKLRRGQINRDFDISAGNTVGQEGGAGSSTGATQFRLRSTLNLAWDIKDFTISTAIEYYSKIAETCNTATNTSNALRARGIPHVNYCTDPGRVIDQYSYRPGTREVVARPGAAPRNVMPSVTYVDLQAVWRAPWHGQFTFGVRNLFDRQPPFCSDCFANSFDPQYRLPGRFYYASYSHELPF